MTTIAPISARRRRTDHLMRGLMATATGLALVPLVLVIYFLLHKGLGAWSGKFFTTDPNGNFLGYPGGIRSAILGTVEIVALATVIAVPMGIGVALWLTEYGSTAVRIISQRVAPSASAASLCSCGTVAITSRAIAETIGRIMIASTNPAMK